MRVPVVLSTIVAAAAGVVGVAGLAAQQNPYVGRWNITGTGPHARNVYFLDVREAGTGLEGTFLDRSGHATPIAWIKVENGELVWQYGGQSDVLPKPPCGPIYRGKIEGGKLVGSHETPGEPCPRPANANVPARPQPAPQTVHWVGVRQPTFPGANANGTHAYGAPVVIVGPGVGKDVWAGLGTDPGQTCVDRWTIADGVLTNAVPERGERSTCNPYTKQKFNDFKFELEFNLGAGQNSGFYLRGRYELQMALQAEGARTPAYPGLLMDIYGWKRADVYAGNPPDQWQVLEGVLVGNRVTATLNGKRVHDNALIPAITGGAMDNDELAPGPIMIQGDHSKVSIRKLVITPIQGR